MKSPSRKLDLEKESQHWLKYSWHNRRLHVTSLDQSRSGHSFEMVWNFPLWENHICSWLCPTMSNPRTLIYFSVFNSRVRWNNNPQSDEISSPIMLMTKEPWLVYFHEMKLHETISKALETTLFGIFTCFLQWGHVATWFLLITLRNHKISHESVEILVSYTTV